MEDHTHTSIKTELSSMGKRLALPVPGTTGLLMAMALMQFFRPGKWALQSIQNAAQFASDSSTENLLG
jgi:hypothetical protein